MLVSSRTYFLIQLKTQISNKNIRYFIESYKHSRLMQISWHTKGGSLKTRVNISKAYPFWTKIGNIEYHSNNIESVIKLIK